MNINKEILLTIVKNSSNRLDREQEIIEINEQQLNIVCKKLTELFSLHCVIVPKGTLPKCKHINIISNDGLDECLDCGVRNY